MDVYFVRLHQYSTSGNMEICFDEEGDSGGHIKSLLSQFVIFSSAEDTFLKYPLFHQTIVSVDNVLSIYLYWLVVVLSEKLQSPE